MTVAQTIEEKLRDALAPVHLHVVDDSGRHAGHAGARPGGETHFNVEVVADAFAGIGPAPGGAFKLADWHDSDWGPVLDDGPGWLGARVAAEPAHAGWGLLVRATIEHIEIGPDPADGLLGYVRGRYQSIPSRP